ncbi:MAG: hypothetical protein ACK55I_50300, partial [bacterium]
MRTIGDPRAHPGRFRGFSGRGNKNRDSMIHSVIRLRLPLRQRLWPSFRPGLTLSLGAPRSADGGPNTRSTAFMD